MTEEKYAEIAKDLAISASMVNLYRKEKRYSKNFRECPFYSELVGKELMLNLLGIKFEYEFNDDVTEYRAVKVENVREELF